MSKDNTGDTAPQKDIVFMQIDCHSEPKVMDVSKEGLLARARTRIWKECPICSAEKEELRIQKLQKTITDQGRWMEIINGEVCIVLEAQTRPHKMIEGKEMHYGQFKQRYYHRRYGKFKGSYSSERMMTLEQRNRLWEEAEVVRETVHRTVRKAERKLIGPFNQNNANLKLSDDKVVCEFHPETVFAVSEWKKAPTFVTNQRMSHNVCGHYRILASGERTWVKSHKRGGL